MRELEKRFLEQNESFIRLREEGDVFTGTFKGLQPEPVAKTIQGKEGLYLVYEFIDSEGKVRTLETKSKYIIKAMSKLLEGDKVRLKRVMNEEGDPRTQVIVVEEKKKTSESEIPIIEKEEDIDVGELPF